MKIQEGFQRKVIADGQSGFTLLEVLVGICILSIGLLGVAKMQVTAIKGNYFSGHTTSALMLAEQKMEDILGSDYATVASQDETNVDGNYHRTTTVLNDNPITNTKTVTIAVRWGPNDDHGVTIACIKPL